MDRGREAEEVHAVFGGDARSERDDVRACVLLDLHCRLDQGEARVPALQAERDGAACAYFERLNCDLFAVDYIGSKQFVRG